MGKIVAYMEPHAAAKNAGTGSGDVAAGNHDHSGVYVPISGALPAGVIVMWSGTKANIPSGWHLCDGNNGTPNLLDRFILSVGAATEAGGTGGATTYSHSGTAVADHAALTHAGTAVADHTNVAVPATATGAGKVGTSTANLATNAHTHTIPTITHSVTQPNNHAALTHGVTQPSDHTNVRPPYFLLAFIMKS